MAYGDKKDLGDTIQSYVGEMLSNYTYLQKWFPRFKVVPRRKRGSYGGFMVLTILGFLPGCDLGVHSSSQRTLIPNPLKDCIGPVRYGRSEECKPMQSLNKDTGIFLCKRQTAAPPPTIPSVVGKGLTLKNPGKDFKAPFMIEPSPSILSLFSRKLLLQL